MLITIGQGIGSRGQGGGGHPAWFWFNLMFRKQVWSEVKVKQLLYLFE